MTRPSSFDRGELVAIEHLAALLGHAPSGEVWTGDDAAVLDGDASVLFATDMLVEGVHFDRAFSSLADIGWKALTTNLSDLAAMGGAPLAAVIAVAGASGADLEGLYAGLVEASKTYHCPLVGGDLSDGPSLVVSVAVLGSTGGRVPTLRSNGRAGDRLYVTGPLGAAAAGLRLLRAGAPCDAALARAHRRPTPRLAEGAVANRLGATAMLDLSDGLGVDLDRLARASGVGAALSTVPVSEGASEEEALGGGDDYELLFSAPPSVDVLGAFGASGLRAPIAIGELVGEVSSRTLRGRPLDRVGFEHGLGPNGGTRRGPGDGPS